MLLLAAVLIIAAAMTKGVFLRPENLIVVIAGASAFGLVSLGQGLVVISGGFDLAVGSLVAMSISSICLFRPSLGMVAATILTVAISLGTSSMSGVIISRTRIPPFIVTLGMLSVAYSMSWILANGQPIYIPEYNNGIVPMFSWLPLGESAFPILVLAICSIALGLLLHRSKWGRYIYAIGDNEPAARVSGVPVRRTKILVYCLSGLMCSFAAIIYLYRNISATPGEGVDYLLLSFAATMVGGVYMYGGTGSVPGILVGVLSLASVTSVLTIAGIPPVIHKGVLGVIVLGVLLLQAKISKT